MKIKRFSKSHYIGVFILLILIISLQIVIFFINKFDFNSTSSISKQEALWLAQENELQSQSDFKETREYKIYPFNPNFISDYKAYKLEMSVQEINRLFAYRKLGKFVNSPQEFQLVTKVSNQWLNKYSKYFKFPEWVHQKNNFSTNNIFEKKSIKIIQKDINEATQEDLEAVFMIGEKTAQRILIDKEKLGSFVSLKQIESIWGISPEAIQDLNKKFTIKKEGVIKRVNVNLASIKDLSSFPYFNYYIAKNIVTYRSMNGDFNVVDDLKKVKDFPLDKFEFIKFYILL